MLLVATPKKESDFVFDLVEHCLLLVMADRLKARGTRRTSALGLTKRREERNDKIAAICESRQFVNKSRPKWLWAA